MPVTYNHEFKNKLKAGFIGCGGHAYRNILPAFQYLPVDLITVCDIKIEKAQYFANVFNVRKLYSNHLEMIQQENLDVVFIVTGYDKYGHILYPRLASDCLENGINVWIEKPPVNSMEDIELLRSSLKKSGKKLAIGFKKMFSPASAKMKEITMTEEFGKIQSISIRYPQYIPTLEELSYEDSDISLYSARVSFLDHLCHPVSLLQYLGGRIDNMLYNRSKNGAGFALFNMKSGASASIHFSSSQSESSNLERTEVTGDGANIVVDNNTRLTYYRPVKNKDFRKYGISSDFTGNIADSPIIWEPEFSLGNLYNKGIFLLGYYNEINYFCDAVLNNRKIETGSLEDAEEGSRIYEAFKQGPNKLIDV